MTKKLQRKLSKVGRLVRHSLSFGTDKTILGLWGENQAKKLGSLGQSVIVMETS